MTARTQYQRACNGAPPGERLATVCVAHAPCKLWCRGAGIAVLQGRAYADSQPRPHRMGRRGLAVEARCAPAWGAGRNPADPQGTRGVRALRGSAMARGRGTQRRRAGSHGESEQGPGRALRPGGGANPGSRWATGRRPNSRFSIRSTNARNTGRLKFRLPISVGHSSTARPAPRQYVSIACRCDRRSSRCALLDTRQWTTVRPASSVSHPPRSTAPHPHPCRGGGRRACGNPAACRCDSRTGRVLVNPNPGRERGSPMDVHGLGMPQTPLEFRYFVLAACSTA